MAVPVDVRDSQIVIPLAGVGFIFRMIGIVCIKDPARRELAFSIIPGRQHGPAIVTTTHDNARPDSVKVRHTRQEPVHSIAGRVIAAVAADSTPAADVAPGGDVIGCYQCGTRQSVEDREKLRPVEDLPFPVDPIRIGLADHGFFSIDGSIRRLAGNLGSTVAIKIIDHELSIMGAFTDISAEIDSPQKRTVYFVGF